jgi:catechol 2,3-dioxygenase-like lactoylglutathione lyase family enzyme
VSRIQPLAACAIAMIIGAAVPAAGAVVGSCHVSPIVADLDRSLKFYRDLIGLEVSPAPPAGNLPWDSSKDLLRLHGLPDARVRHFVARIPGMRCGIEPVQFDEVDRKPVAPRMQDPGAVTLILLVRDIDAAFAPLKAAGVTVVTTGGAPVMPSPTSKTRAVIVKDPDGHFVELAQLEPPPATTVPASSNVFDIRFRFTVSDLDRTVQYYQEHLGIPGKSASFAGSKGVMAMMGLPETVEYRVNMTPIPGSSLILEFLELKGIDRTPVRARVQDPGAYRLQLTVDDVDRTIAALKAAGSRPISNAAAADLNNLFLVLQQGQLP